MSRLLAGLSVVVLLICGCGKAPDAGKDQLLFCVAASTKDVAEQLAGDFRKAHRVEVEVMPGPSSGLARQIVETGKADLFLSADEASADVLAGKDLVSQRKNLLTNKLAVIVPADSKLDISELSDLDSPEVKRIAMAEPKVPAGEYARDALRKTELLASIEPKIVGAIDVRATLQFVAHGEADAGFVYITDTIGNSKVRVAFEVDAKLHRPIVYPLVLVKHPAINEAARKFYDELSSPASAKIFEAAGFGVSPRP